MGGEAVGEDEGGTVDVPAALPESGDGEGGEDPTGEFEAPPDAEAPAGVALPARGEEVGATEAAVEGEGDCEVPDAEGGADAAMEREPPAVALPPAPSVGEVLEECKEVPCAEADAETDPPCDNVPPGEIEPLALPRPLADALPEGADGVPAKVAVPLMLLEGTPLPVAAELAAVLPLAPTAVALPVAETPPLLLALGDGGGERLPPALPETLRVAPERALSAAEGVAAADTTGADAAGDALRGPVVL